MKESGERSGINSSVSFVGKHWGAIASLAYLYLVFIGMFSAYFEYRPYNINIFEYSTLEDFLLGVFKSFLVFIIGILVAIYLLAFIFWAEPTFQDKQSWKTYSTLITITIAVGLVVIIGLINFFKDEKNIEAELLRVGHVNIELRQGNLKDVINKNDEELEYYRIGSQGGFVFIVAYNKDKTYKSDIIIVPISNISAIGIYKPTKMNMYSAKKI